MDERQESEVERFYYKVKSLHINVSYRRSSVNVEIKGCLTRVVGENVRGYRGQSWNLDRNLRDRRECSLVMFQEE